MIENLKLGPLDGFNALIVIVFLAIALVVLIAVLFTCILKAIKEKNDEKEDKAENEFSPLYPHSLPTVARCARHSHPSPPEKKAASRKKSRLRRKKLRL